MTTLLYLWHVCQCLIVDLLLGFIEHLLRIVLSIKLYKSFLHELFPRYLCPWHLESLDDITHVAKSVRSVRHGLCGVKWGSMNRLSRLFLQQNHISVFVSEWCEGQFWFGLPECTCTCTLTYIFVEHHLVLCGHRLGSGTTWPSQWIVF